MAVVLFGGGAVALFTLGGDSDKSSSTTVLLGGNTTISSADNGPDISSPGETPITSGGNGEIPTGITGTRDVLVPVGQIADIGGGWRLQVLDVIPDTSELMEANDDFFDPAPAGSTYMLVKMALGYFGSEDPKIGYEPDVSVLGTSSVALDNFCLAHVPDEVGFLKYVFSGGVLIGNACFIAPLNEAGTFQLFGKGDFFADDGAYLDLTPPSAAAQPMAALFGPQPGAVSTPARLAPTPVGTTTQVGSDWELTVTGAARDITTEVLNENQFNEPPPDGFHFVGVDVTYTYNGSGGASPAQMSVASVGSNNVQHTGYCGLAPNEVDLFTDLFAGGSASGTLCLVVPDNSGDIALFATSDFSGYTWFATS